MSKLPQELEQRREDQAELRFVQSQEIRKNSFKIGFDAGALAVKELAQQLVDALEYYANDKNWYLHKDAVTGAEVRRSIELGDTESFGYQESPEAKNILQVFAGKHAKEALAKWQKDWGQG